MPESARALRNPKITAGYIAVTVIRAMGIDSKELKDFISSAIKDIKSELDGQDFGLVGAVEFELGIVTVKKKGVGVSIHVIDASAKYDKEVISKIKFYAAPKGSRFERASR